MSTIRKLLDELRETDVTAARLRIAADQSPDDQFLRINAETLEKRKADLTRRLDYQLAVDQEDLIEYNLMRGERQYPARAVAASLLSFQEMITAIFDAFRGAPKRQYRPSAENISLSSMDFAAARTGSVIVSMHIPNERLLLTESTFDQTFEQLFVLLSTRRREDFRGLVDRIGVASLTKAYEWANVSVNYSLDTSIAWAKSKATARAILVPHTQALRIREAIDATSEESDEVVEYDCTLVGIDATAKYFHIRLPDGAEIKGATIDSFPQIEWTTERPYRARLNRSSVLKYATGIERITWLLMSLEPIE
jgi:hypothetical protein